ncbi:hypothetical protein BGX34_009865 [Mortierella sp. NVP85]|nr:hypothetical protein BGX34_009865 [Mortierella sp. NVP85]
MTKRLVVEGLTPKHVTVPNLKRLEYSGDAVLDAVALDFWTARDPDLRQLKMRLEESKSTTLCKTLTDVVEALFGAVFPDSNMSIGVVAIH